MIIGKSLTALGGGGLKPEITVTAKAGALLNLHFKDSSIILQSYQLGADEEQHTFVASVSDTAYVVEDVTNSASVEVLVDSIAQYSVEIMYTLYLYDGSDNGNEFIDVTGGWVGSTKKIIGAGNVTTPTIIRNNNNIKLTIPLSGDSYATFEGSFITENTVDVSNYNLLKFEMTEQPERMRDWGWTAIYVTASKTDNNTAAKILDNEDSIADGLMTLDISALSGMYYVGMNFVSQAANSNIPTYTVTKIWLE